MRAINLRGRILEGFALFTLVLFFLMVGLAIFSYHLGEDSALTRVVQTKSNIQEFSTANDIPATLPSNLLDYPLGVHELSGADSVLLIGSELHAYKFNADGEHRIRVLQLEERNEFLPLAKVYALFALLTIILLIGFGGWAGRTIAQRLSRPMEELAAQLQRPDAMDGTVAYSNNNQTGEIAQVATAMDAAISRVNDTLEREVTLSRNISHELRTPLTVIRTALDTGSALGSTPSKKALDSARRASEEMELLTSACLDLARDTQSHRINASTNIVATVKQIVRESLHLLDSKDVQLDLHCDKNNIELPASEPLVRLIVGNIIRNSFIHSSTGFVQIDISSRQLSITNLTKIPEQSADNSNLKATDLMPANDSGFGFGLSIMGQACKRLDWTHEISRSKSKSDATNQIMVTVHFAKI